METIYEPALGTQLCQVCRNAVSRLGSKEEVDCPGHETFKALRAALKEGCQLCNMGYADGKNYIHKESDPGDEVRQRLNFSSRLHIYGRRRPNWLEYEARDYHYHIEFNIQVNFHEVDTIHRPTGGLHQISVTPPAGMSCPETSFKNADHAKHLSARKARLLESCQSWINHYLENHEACRISRDESAQWPPKLPTRVLDLHSDDPELISLHLSEHDERAAYITLSHRWREDTFELRDDNHAKLERGIETRLLPQKFQDAVVVGRFLGIRWLWIDSMCIIQRPGDWLKESGRMCEYYKNSLVNLAATGAANWELDGLFPKEELAPTSIPLVLQPATLSGCEDRSSGDSCIYAEVSGDWLHTIERGELSVRGWVLQERVLSPRTLHFARGQVFWECAVNLRSEALPRFDHPTPPRFVPDGDSSPQQFREQINLIRRKIPPKDSDSDLQAHAPNLFWRSLVHRYSGCWLTKEEDQLVAISGLAQEYMTLTGDEYLAGLWKSSILYDLVWSFEPPTSTPAEMSHAPSWSWASQPCARRLTMHHGKYRGVELAKYVSCNIKPCLEGNITGPIIHGHLRLAGRLLTPTRDWEQGSSNDWRFSIFGMHLRIDVYWDRQESWNDDGDQIGGRRLSHKDKAWSMLLESGAFLPIILEPYGHGQKEVSLVCLVLRRQSQGSTHSGVGPNQADQRYVRVGLCWFPSYWYDADGGYRAERPGNHDEEVSGEPGSSVRHDKLDGRDTWGRLSQVDVRQENAEEASNDEESQDGLRESLVKEEADVRDLINKARSDDEDVERSWMGMMPSTAKSSRCQEQEIRKIQKRQDQFKAMILAGLGRVEEVNVVIE